MAEDSSRSDPRPADPLSQSKELIEALFRNYANQAWIASAIKGDKQSWGGSLYREDRLAAFDPQRGHYIANCMVKAGSTARNLKTFEAGVIVVADDVGYMAPEGSIPLAPGAEVDIHEFRLFAPETSYEVETSQGNFQMSFAIWPPERSIARWGFFLAELRKTRFGKAFAKTDAVHYGRLPSGSNQPKRDRARFKSRLAKEFKGKTYTLDELALAFGIDMSPVSGGGSVPGVGGQKPSFSSTLTQAETCSMETLHRLIGLLPNDKQFDERPSWISIGAAIRNISEANGCPDEGLGLWLAWCAQRYQDDGAPERLWDSVYEPRANAATLRKYVEARYGGKASREYQSVAAVISQDQAREAFEKVEGEPGVGSSGADPFGPADAPDEETQAKLKFRELLEAIRKTQKVPDHHRVTAAHYDDHWLLPGGGLLDIGSLSGSLPVAPPVIFEPFVRGGLTVVGGAPSVGKSSLMLNHALAIVAGRGDLIRRGVKLQFAGDVIYVSNEDDLSVLRRRAAAWAKHHGVDLKALPYRLIPVRTALFKKGDKETWHAACLEVLESVLAHCRTGRDIAMIVVDTLGTSMQGGDEYVAKDITPVMGLLRDLAAAFWGSVAFLHHTTKETWAKGSEAPRSIAMIRGSGGITGTYTRGATLIVTPNASELKDHPDWVDQDIVVEFMAKANDGPEGFVAGYYRRVLVSVEQVSAVDGLKTEWRMEPVLVPFTVVAFGTDVAVLDGYVATIQAWGSEVRVVEKAGPNGSPNSVQSVLKVNNAQAKTIVDRLVAANKCRIKIVERDAKNNKLTHPYRVLEVEENPF